MIPFVTIPNSHIAQHSFYDVGERGWRGESEGGGLCQEQIINMATSVKNLLEHIGVWLQFVSDYAVEYNKKHYDRPTP